MREARLVEAGRSPASDAPHFLVGRDRQAGWVVVETHGRCGGLFCTADAALRFAREAAEGHAETIEFAAGPLEFTLDFS